MKRRENKDSYVQVRQLLLLGAFGISTLVLLAAPVPGNKPTSYPAWWFSQGAIAQTNAHNPPSWPNDYHRSDDYVVINQGQLKSLATAAYYELQAKAPPYIWSTSYGIALTSMVNGWNPANGDAYAAVNLGQLKTVAAPFYNLLIQLGYAINYPWTGVNADDYAAANIGQAKHLFSFDVGLDSAGDGVPDWWEQKYLGSVGTAASTLSPSGNGLTLLQDYDANINPTAAGNNSAVSVTIPYPSAGALIDAGSNLVAVAKAQSTGGTIDHIAFFFDSQYVGTASGLPPACTLPGVTAGTHTLIAVAVDSTGATAQATSTFTAAALDTDGNGLSDFWQLQYFGHLGGDPNADPDGDGISNLNEFRNGTDPTDYYNGQPVTLTIIQGNGQTAWTGRYLDQSLQVKVTRNGAPLVNAPVQFNAGSLSGLLATDLGKAQSQTLQALTDANGIATIFYYQSADLTMDATLTASAGPSATAATATLLLSAPPSGAAIPAGGGAIPSGTPPPTPANPPPPADGSIQLYSETVQQSHSKVGFNTFTTTVPPQIYLEEADWDLGTPPFAGSASRVQATRVTKYNPETGAATSTYSPVVPDMQVAGDQGHTVVVTTSATLRFTSGWATVYGYDACSQSLSDLYTTQALIGLVQSDMPAFTGSLTPASQTASYELSADESSFALRKMQYRFVSTGTQTVSLNWLIVFQPDDTTQPILTKAMTWTGVASSFPLMTVDPTTQKYDNGSPGPKQKGNGTITLVPIELAVDVNRDGKVVMANDTNDPNNVDSHGNPLPADTTSQAKPFQFWLNDDQDDLSNSSPGETEPPTKADYLNKKINTVRNLEDFSRLWIYLKGLSSAINPTLGSSPITIGLEWHSNTGGASDGWATADGAPAINIYQAVEQDGGTKYLFGDKPPSTGLSSATDPNNTTALAQTAGNYNNALGQVAKGTPFYFPASFWSTLTDSNPKAYLLFEGAAEGKGRLVITFNTGGPGNYTKIGEGGAVYMDLLNIKKMYVRAQVNLSGVAADGMASPYSNVSSFVDPAPLLSSGPFDSIQYDQPPDQTNQVIVFVHGINQPVPSYIASSESVFKRLFWSGYKGKFAAFRWPCLTPGGVWKSFSFNESEYRGWKCGGALKQFVASLPESSKNIFAFSQGNTVVGAAFEQGLTVHNYVMIEAAVPAGCYDTSSTVNGFADMLSAEASHQTPDWSNPTFAATPVIETGGDGLGYRGYIANLHSAGFVSGLVVNFNNFNDWALASGTTLGIRSNWESNEEWYKPNSSIFGTSYTYGATLTPMAHRAQVAGYTASRDVTDYDECMGFVSRPRSKAVGALNTTSGSVDLNINTSVGPYFMGNIQSDHTAYYLRNFQTTSSLYQMLNTELTAP